MLSGHGKYVCSVCFNWAWILSVKILIRALVASNGQVNIDHYHLCFCSLLMLRYRGKEHYTVKQYKLSKLSVVVIFHLCSIFSFIN